MNKTRKTVDTVRPSRAGHTFHERWAARRALQLVFPRDDLFAVVVEGLSPNESLKLGKEAEDIADLILFYGMGDTFETCSTQQILQFKYKEAAEPVTSSYLKKTLKKFSATLREFRKNVPEEKIARKLTFGFITNAVFSDDLWDAIASLKSGDMPKERGAKRQRQYLEAWCQEEEVEAAAIFPLVEFRASTADLPTQNRYLRRTISDWSADSSGQAAKRLFALVELVREKAQIEGQGKNSIRREDVLDALECDEDQLFPADTRFVDVVDVIERGALQDVKGKVETSNRPIFLHADGGVGKTVFIQSLAANLRDSFEIVVFDCFGGGAYRSEAQARHLPRVGLLQIVNELATRGLCDPLLPTDSDQYGLIEFARKRLKQASETVINQSALRGILVILDAADNAQLEAEVRSEASFPRLLLESLSSEPIEGVKLLLTARPHRMDGVIGNSRVERLELETFSKEETRRFLETRRENIADVEFSTALARSRGNARVLEYLVESWDANVSGNAPKTKISVEELIGQKCGKIFRDLHTAGWSDGEVREFFAALSLLPPPIPLTELAEALGWSESQVNSAASDLAPMLELVRHGAMFRDEPTETYIKDNYASEREAQQSIAQRLQARQKISIYAAEALPHFLVVIGDSDRAYQLASSNEFPAVIESEFGRRRLKLSRLYAAFSLATREKDFDRVLSLTMQLSQVASANARGDQFIRRFPALATILGDSDASRRLFNDRSGWRGARDTRLVVAYSFADELDEAHIHQNRAIGWVNWYLHNDDETKRFDRSGPEASDIAAVMFLNVLRNEFSSFNRNMKIWRINFGLSVIRELISLCAHHEASSGSSALQNLVNFASSKKCLSVSLQIGFLSIECGISRNQLKSISRAASALSNRQNKTIPEENFDSKLELQDVIASAAMCSLIANSRQSANRIFNLCRHRRPSSYDYGERHGMNRVWAPTQSACIAAWSVGEHLKFHHLIPQEVKLGRKAKSTSTEAELSVFLGSVEVTDENHSRRTKKGPIEKRKQFTQRECEDIVSGAACVMRLVAPLEAAILPKQPISNGVLSDFLTIWQDELRPEVHWRAEVGKDVVARQVGIGLAQIMLRYCEAVEKKEAEQLLKIVSENRFALGDKLQIFKLIARRSNLADVAGAYARALSNDIQRDDHIEQRGEYYQDLAAALIPMSIEEAQDYYAQGLAQLDQMGSEDFDLIYSAMHYAAEQPGGHVRPELSHRFMNLCQTIFQHEPSKFGWTLFGRAAASSIGFSAIYKLIRWHDQDVVNYSYGLPQLACFLAKERLLDARRAAVLLTICKDHGWHEWQIGKGLNDLLLVARPEDRQSIITLVTEKLEREHTFGGWEGVWDSLLTCLAAFEEDGKENLRSHIEALREAARQRRSREDERRNYSESAASGTLNGLGTKQDEQSSENAFAAILAKCDPTSASSLDRAIQDIQASDQLRFGDKKRFFDEIRQSCSFDARLRFLEAVCESAELEFGFVLDLMIECIDLWGDSTAHVKKSIPELIKKLFAFKGSELFNLRYSGISRQIHRLSELCGDPNFVLEIVLETIAKERLELDGDEWLQIATSLSVHTKPSTAIDALEDLLSSSAAKIGDEIGEGAYRAAFAGKMDEADVIADIIWHLLGDSDAFVRWSVARSLKGMLTMGLTGDVERLLERFDESANLSLASDDHHFAFENAQQWFLMGLLRATLHHGEKLNFLKPKIETLAKRDDLHVVNKLHLARCWMHIEGKKPISPELAQFWSEIQTPSHGFVVRVGWPGNKERWHDFNFDYEFDKHKVSNLSHLFSISKNEASDFIADEVKKRWPDSKSMSDFPGGINYRSGDRFETYRGQVQRHAYIHAATTLMKNRPVGLASYHSYEWDPWKEFLGQEDVSFEDGSWLSDHKDRVPVQARVNLLGQRNGKQETLVDQEALFRKIGVSRPTKSSLLPLYGHWKSPDGVHVSIISALIKAWGAVGHCANLSKAPDHDLWLPSFDSDGRIDRFTAKSLFDPLIWAPESYPIGIDESDEWATRGAIARPKLGLALSKLLGLTPDEDEREWHDRANNLVLKSSVWGEWRLDPDAYRGKSLDEGEILWADRDWLERTLQTCNKSLVYVLRFSKNKSYKSYDDSSGVRRIYVGLKRRGEAPRFWFAKKASETVY